MKDKHLIEHWKELEPDNDLPKDVQIALQTFVDNAIMVEEYDLEYLPGEVMTNLLGTISNYPKLRPMLEMLVMDMLPELNMVLEEIKNENT
jgi:hypothetical protein